MQKRINALLLELALNSKNQRCQRHGRELLVWEEQYKLKRRTLEIRYKISIHRLEQELRRCHHDKVSLQFWYGRVVPSYEKWKNKTQQIFALQE